MQHARLWHRPCLLSSEDREVVRGQPGMQSSTQHHAGRQVLRDLLLASLGECGLRAGLPMLCVRAVFTVGFSTGWLAMKWPGWHSWACAGRVGWASAAGW